MEVMEVKDTEKEAKAEAQECGLKGVQGCELFGVAGEGIREV